MANCESQANVRKWYRRDWISLFCLLASHYYILTMSVMTAENNGTNYKHNRTNCKTITARRNVPSWSVFYKIEREKLSFVVNRNVWIETAKLFVGRQDFFLSNTLTKS